MMLFVCLGEVNNDFRIGVGIAIKFRTAGSELDRNCDEDNIVVGWKVVRMCLLKQFAVIK